MKISYLSPKKNVKTFSFRNMKPVLIFTADKHKEKDNFTYTEVKKKILSDSANKIESMNYGVNGGRISPSKLKIQNGSLSKKLNIQFLNGKNYQ